VAAWPGRTSVNDPFAEPSGSREEILKAAYRALCRYGYADLTIQRIGGEFEKSPTLIYHHYGSKDELLVDLLAFLLDDFEERISVESFDLPPRQRIVAYVRAMCDPTGIDDEDAPDAAFLRAVVELRTQATHDRAYREHFERSDRVFGRFLERSVREAAEALEPAAAGADGEPSVDGERDDGDVPTPDAVASLVMTVASGGTFRWATMSENAWTEDVIDGVERYLDAVLPLIVVE